MDTIKAAIVRMLTIQNILGAVILIVWLTMKFLKVSTDPTVDQVVMLVVGFIFGSSDGSKVKDPIKTAAPAAPPAALGAPRYLRSAPYLRGGRRAHPAARLSILVRRLLRPDVVDVVDADGPWAAVGRLLRRPRLPLLAGGHAARPARGGPCAARVRARQGARLRADRMFSGPVLGLAHLGGSPHRRGSSSAADLPLGLWVALSARLRAGNIGETNMRLISI